VFSSLQIVQSASYLVRDLADRSWFVDELSGEHLDEVDTGYELQKPVNFTIPATTQSSETGGRQKCEFEQQTLECSTD